MSCGLCTCFVLTVLNIPSSKPLYLILQCMFCVYNSRRQYFSQIYQLILSKAPLSTFDPENTFKVLKV
jgi:hypothetical protein